MSNITILIDETFMNKLIEDKLENLLKNYKRQYASVGIKDLVTLTGLSKSTLQNKIVCEPEIVEVTRRIGSRVIYLIHKCLKLIKKLLIE